MSDSKREQLEALLAPVVEGHGLLLHGVEYVAGRSSALLRVYIDHLDRHITIEDCEAVSRDVSASLDVNDPISGAYRLEISSPGFDRPLFRPEHWTRFIGSEVKAETALPIEGRKRFRGQIVAVEDGRARIEGEGQAWSLPLTAIAKARLVPEYERRDPPGAGDKPNKAKPSRGKAR